MGRVGGGAAGVCVCVGGGLTSSSFKVYLHGASKF